MWPFSKRSLENPQIPISDPKVMSLLFGDMASEAGETVNADTALKVPAIWGAVNFLAGTMASLPLQVFKTTSEGREVNKTDPVYPLVHHAPNEEWTSFRWRKYSMMMTLTRGRSFTFIERNRGGRIINLWPLEPSKVTVQRQAGRTFYEYRDEGQQSIYAANEIIDIPFLMDGDQVGTINPVDRLRDVIGLSLALQTYAARHFKNGGVPPLVLQGPGMSPAAAARASDDVKAAIRKAITEGRNAITIPEGYELKPLGIDPEKSQLEAARRFQVEEVARVYALPPVFLQDLTRATFSNNEQQDLHLVKHTLRQWLTCWEQEMNLKLFPARERSRYIEFNVDGLLRGDFKTRMDGYAQAIQNSINTPNEARAKENMPPKEGGDNLYIQQNMSEMGKLNQETNQETGDED